jgi:uncharacterized protein (TIGR03382 family)
VGGGPEDAGAVDEGEADGGSSVCEQVPSGSNACQLQDLPCDSTTDCPDGLECLEQYTYGECTGGGGTGGTAGMYAGAGGAGGIPADGGFEDPYVCPEPEIEHKCMPRSYGGGGGTAGMGGGSGTGGGVADAGVDEPGGMAGTGAAGTGMSAGAGGAGGETGAEDGEGEGHGRGRGWLKRLLGCSTSGPVSSSEGSMGWLMLGVAAMVLRRRAIKR